MGRGKGIPWPVEFDVEFRGGRGLGTPIFVVGVLLSSGKENYAITFAINTFYDTFPI